MRPRDLLESDCLLHNPLTETKMREACEIGVSKRSFRIIHESHITFGIAPTGQTQQWERTSVQAH